MSVGTIWAVGGIAPVSTAILDGHGGFLGSGTNAPLYTTSFSAARPKAQEDLVNHENRLADALGLDRVQRVFEYRLWSPYALKPELTPKCIDAKEVSRTTWNGSQWTNRGPEPSESML